MIVYICMYICVCVRERQMFSRRARTIQIHSTECTRTTMVCPSIKKTSQKNVLTVVSLIF
ncbi:hypothetical protein HanXRQr2_Chr02g0082881 [Helianthus annuus]|uniref:Uncharacterized protein n=1 Tax=Helianthus annuus TaxID=4232 RepID=A0A9K3P0V4_HELAN|nr:hypothetical protein HanXRQr2_Chr02g0082881 [Helianthus annuus]KAJ0953116.1 hypothetical protein HanPSC8_Chr02g0080251 [Helianthus annuus]